MCFFFFFKQKTAYEMRISDWSSDVCSSDLTIVTNDEIAEHVNFVERLTEAFPALAGTTSSTTPNLPEAPKLRSLILLGGKAAPGFVNQASFDAGALTIGEDVIHRARVGVRVRDTAMILYTSGTRSEERRVGKECVSPCRSRRSQYL